MSIEDIKYAQERLTEIREAYELLKASNDALHEKKLAAAQTPKEVDVENKEHEERTQKAAEAFRLQEKHASADLKRMEDKMPPNQNLHSVGEDQARNEPPKQYAAIATEGVPQYGGLPVGKTANDNEPGKGPPGGGGAGSKEPEPTQSRTQPASPSSDSPGPSPSNDNSKSDFSAPPAPLPPPPPPPENERKLAR